jgi:hypothetical protein
MLQGVTVKNPIPLEVTHAHLGRYSDASLAGRLSHYRREAIFERDAALRFAWQAQVEATKNEIARRRYAAASEADKVFNGVSS